MKYLFCIARQYSVPIIKPLVAFLEKTNHEFTFFLSERVQKNLPQEWSLYKICYSIQQTIEYQPDFVIVPGNFVDFRIPGIKVQIFHGLGVEKQSHYKIRHFFDVYLTSGPFVTEKFVTLQRKHKYFLVSETGWPKVDYILQYPITNLKQRMNIPSDKKVILYAPTFSKEMQSATKLLPIIPKIMREDEIWLFKFHELMDAKVVESFKRNKIENMLFIDSHDITPYLHVSDVMISDTSSVIYEFMVIDKPVITFNTQSRIDKGINITNPDDIREALDRSLKNPAEFQEKRKQHLREINPYLDGRISERVFTTLSEIKTNDKLPKRNKPFILLTCSGMVSGFKNVLRRANVLK